MNLLWHYTTVQKLMAILESGEIRPATAGVPVDEAPLVWFSTRQDWEPTATKMIRGEDGSVRPATMEEMVALGIARCGALPGTAPIAWRDLRQHVNMPVRAYEALARAGKRLGANPDDWYCSASPIPMSECGAIEIYVDDDWTDIFKLTGQPRS